MWAALCAAFLIAMLVPLAVPAPAAAVDLTPLAGSDGCLYTRWSSWYYDNPPVGCAEPDTNLRSISDMVLSPDGAMLYALSYDGYVRAFDRAPATGILTARPECWSSAGGADGCASILPLETASAITMSTDGRSVYLGDGNGTVLELDRDPATGAMSQAPLPGGCHGGLQAPAGCTSARGADAELVELDLAPDGSTLYAASPDGQFAIYQRDTMTGALSQLPSARSCWMYYTTDWSGNPCSTTSQWSWSFTKTAVTPDGEHAYVAAYDDLLTFDRTLADGTLDQAGCYGWEGWGGTCTVGASRGFDEAYSLALSPDGSNLYVVGYRTILAFEVDPVSGALTQLPGTSGCLGQTPYAPVGACAPLRGFQSESDITVSPDGTTVYATSGKGIVILDRDPGTGALTQRAGRRGCITAMTTDTATASCTITGAATGSWDIQLSPDGQNLYVMSSDEGIITLGNPAAECVDYTPDGARNDRPRTMLLDCVGLDPDARTFEIVTPPTNGTLGPFDHATGRIIYTPDAGFVGTDSFTFRGTDGLVTTAPALVTIAVRDPSPPVATTPPTIAGAAEVGALLTPTHATFTSAMPLTSGPSATWERCAADGTNCQYIGYGTPLRVTATDLGSRIRFTSQANNIDGSTTSSSALTDVVVAGPAPAAIQATIGGYRYVGYALQANVVWASTTAVTTTYAWERCDATLTTCTPLGVTSSGYTPVAADAGSRIRVEFTGTDAAGTTVVTAATTAITNGTPTGPSIVGRPTITGTTLVGETLVATPAAVSDTSTGSEYQWRRCRPDGTLCDDIPGATHLTYLLTPADDGTSLVFFQREQLVGVLSWRNWKLSDETAEVRDASEVGTQPPVNQSLPTVTDAEFDYYADGDYGAWSGVQPISYAYAWLRCDTAGANCTPIGSTGGYRWLTFADAGTRYRLQVTATNADGTSTAVSAASWIVPEPPPVEGTGASQSTFNAQVEGLPAVADPGTWQSLSPITTLRLEVLSCPNAAVWNLTGCTTALDSTSSTTYTPVAADIDRYLHWRFHATNTIGTTTGTWRSTSQPIRPAAPINLTPPTVTGTMTIGSTLTASDGDWSASRPVTLTRRWLRCMADGTNCSSQVGTGPTYTLVAQDEDASIRLDVTAVANGTLPSGWTTLRSDATTAVPLQPPRIVRAPMIAGMATVGGRVYSNVDPGDWYSPRAVTITRQWMRCDADGSGCLDMPGVTGQTYDPVVADWNHVFRVRHTASNAAGSSSNVTALTAVVPPPPPTSTDAPVVSGIAREGNTLSSTTGTFTSVAPMTYAYQWHRCPPFPTPCSPIAGATGATHALTATDIGTTFIVQVTASNGGGSAVRSGFFNTPVQPLPPVSSADPVVTGTHRVGMSLTAAATFTSSVGHTTSLNWYHCRSDGTDCRWLGNGVTFVVPAQAIGRHVLVHATAYNAGGSTTATSAVGPEVVGGPQLTTPPLLTGTGRVGDQLVASAAIAGSAPIDVTRTWLRCAATGSPCTVITGVTGTSYVTTASDIRSLIRVRFTAANTYGATSDETNGIVVAGDGPIAMAPSYLTVSSATVGVPLTLQLGTWRDALQIAISWERCDSVVRCATIVGAVDATYVPADADVGFQLRARVTASNPAGSTLAWSQLTGIVVRDVHVVAATNAVVQSSTTNASAVARWVLPVGLPSNTAFDVRVRERSASGALLPIRTYEHRITRQWVLAPRVGGTACVSVRVHDGRRTSTWSVPACVTRATGAGQLRRVGAWRRVVSSQRTTQRGATIQLATRQAVRRILIRARRCSSCGRLLVEWNGRTIQTLDLRGRAGVVAYDLPPLARPTRGTVRLRVVSRGRIVEIQSIALQPDVPF